MIAVADDLDRSIAIDRPAQRIVSLVPSLTETLFSLGVGSSLAAVTRFCTEPPAAIAAVVKVGGTKNPDVAAIVALRPDLVVVNAEENRRADFDALVEAGLRVFVSYPHRVADTAGLMERLGELVGAPARAAELAATLRRCLARAVAPTTRVRVFCPIWKNPWMSFNADTYADDMLRLAGGNNVCAPHADRYPTVDLAAIAALEPDVVLLPDEPYVFAAKDLPALDALRETPALRNGRVHFIDGKGLSWYGPRSAAAVECLRSLLAR